MTRAAGNTLLLRTYKQMFKTIRPKDILDPTKNIKLVAYNGQEVPRPSNFNCDLEKTLHPGKGLCC